MLKAAIIGCGKIADAHAAQILRVGNCEIVGVCDREPLMAEQLRDRFPIQHAFTDVSDLFRKVKPDIVHITTPPQGHYELAKFCLENGASVYVEKPFTIDGDEAQKLVDLASRTGLKLTVGHNYQFSHAARRMRQLIASGYVGEPVHMESYYSYDLSDPSYARALLSDKNHWVRRLPGRLLHNIISHGVARIAEYLKTDNPRVIAHGFVSPLLKSMDESEIVDELRVIISEESGTTAYFTFSSQMRPSIHEFRIYGSKNGAVLDQNHEIVLKLRGVKFKSYADHFLPPLLMAKQNLDNFRANFRLFLNKDFHMDSGMKYLIESFYQSVGENAPLPISYREIVLTARIMDSIFAQIKDAEVKGPSGLDRQPAAVGA